MRDDHVGFDDSSYGRRFVVGACGDDGALDYGRRWSEAGLRASGGHVAAASGDLPLDVLAAERLLGVQSIVSFAENTQIWQIAASGECAGVNMVDLEKGAGRTSLSVGAHKSALLAVARVDIATGRTGHISMFGSASFPWMRRSTQSIFIEFGNQEINPALEHDREIARWVLMAHELRRAFDLVAQLSADRELQEEAGLCEWLEPALCA